VLEVPTWLNTLELRPDIQFSGVNHSLVIRSRHFLQAKTIEYSNPDEEVNESDAHSDLSDLFFSSNWANSFSTTVGLQNYQWGPAEILSPSNPFFHFASDQRSFFYKEKGRVLLRANWTPDPQQAHWSIVGMYEPIDNQTRFWTADKEFKPKSAMKIEYQFENPANSIAVVGGQGEDQRGFVGEYATFSPVEGFSVYLDAQHRSGRSNYVPEANALGFYDLVDSQDDRTFTLAVFGFRWEGRVDFRQEFIINEAGYDPIEWPQAKASALTASPNVLLNAKRFAAPGLELRTQTYSYTSLRVPDVGPSKNASLSARWLSSMEHDSSVLQLNFEYNWNDRTVLSVEGLQFMGNPSGEFRIANDSQASAGFRWSY
jgi:hypothetical protein